MISSSALSASTSTSKRERSRSTPGVRDRLANEDALRHARDGLAALNASSAAVTATPRSTSAPRSARTSSTAAICVVMSKTSNQPMWPSRKIFPFSSPWPFAIVIPKRSRTPRMTSPESMPAGRADRGHDRAPVLVRREELEAERLHARARGAAEADVPVERSFQSLREQEVERDVEPRDERDGQRDRRVELLLRLARSLPVEVEARRRPGRRQRGLGDGGEAEPGRGHQRLLRPGDDDVEAPRVGLARDGAEARHRVDDDERIRPPSPRPRAPARRRRHRWRSRTARTRPPSPPARRGARGGRRRRASRPRRSGGRPRRRRTRSSSPPSARRSSRPRRRDAARPARRGSRRPTRRRRCPRRRRGARRSPSGRPRAAG